MKSRSEPGWQEAGRSRPHESAAWHVNGRAVYVDDLPEPAGTLHAALGLSPVAHGELLSIDLERLRAQPGVVAVFSAADIPGLNDCGAVVRDDPILAQDRLLYLGQPVFLVVATSRVLARRAAALAAQVIASRALPAVLDARQAHSRGDYVLPPMHLLRGDAAAAIARAPRVLEGQFAVGGQEQFYLEGQISLALPQEDGGIRLLASTQHPSEMQHAVARALGLAAHRVEVECRRMGGGFGGKESQSAVFACAAALAAAKLQRPVKLRPDRDDDFFITGRRHAFEYDWRVGFDETGRVLGLQLTLIANAGFSADLSGAVMARAICHVDNAYFLPAVDIRGVCARTNTQSNTAFRGFGAPQGALVTEVILEKIAQSLGRDPLAVRAANFYCEPQQTTPFGQAVDEALAPELVAELAKRSRYAERREAIERFNATSPVIKRGISLTPVKFGIAFNVEFLNQAGALVHVYTDGSVLVNHGGTEMGQGLHTKVAQVVAQELGLPFDRVKATATATAKVANTSATAASTGSDLNGKAAQDAARRIRERLIDFLAQRHEVAPETIRFSAGRVSVGELQFDFAEVAEAAYLARVQLWSEGFYATPGLSWDAARMQGSPFQYFAWGAALSEVALDTLTGESRLVAAELLHDVGTSINPAIDIGQIEGGFVQGMGWLTSEELVWDGAGRLLTHAPSTYKIPTAQDVPDDFKVSLYGRPNGADTIYRSKAVGEPPLLLAFSVFLALREAASAARGQPVELNAPATPEALLKAIHAP